MQRQAVVARERGARRIFEREKSENLGLWTFQRERRRRVMEVSDKVIEMLGV